MTRFRLVILLGGFWGTGACGQSGGDAGRRPLPPVDLARIPARAALDAEPPARQADSLRRAGEVVRIVTACTA